ncbi:hypothetical protein SUGI_0233320 [Cryptomeria japonica]|nr:hypothetical protein SUGI_0233320 [Cryptomeria japonica]
MQKKLRSGVDKRKRSGSHHVVMPSQDVTVFKAKSTALTAFAVGPTCSIVTCMRDSSLPTFREVGKLVHVSKKHDEFLAARGRLSLSVSVAEQHFLVRSQPHLLSRVCLVYVLSLDVDLSDQYQSCKPE